ncbi:histidine phosphatase family protein, partial [bacterium]|nr:histidine phosphatase family protein [bacterium]
MLKTTAKTITVILVRLCECEGNLAGKIASHGNLTSLGKQQAEATRKRLVRSNFVTYYSADNSACYETAQILANGKDVGVMSEFNGAPSGEWSGQTLTKVKESYPDEWTAYFEPKPGRA